jgi:hypothetical protein
MAPLDPCNCRQESGKHQRGGYVLYAPTRFDQVIPWGGDELTGRKVDNDAVLQLLDRLLHRAALE